MRISGDLQEAVIQHARADMAAAPMMWVDPPEPPSVEMKIGEGALAAMGRVGWDEIGQALKAFPDSIGPMEEPGLPFTATQAIVSEQMGYGHHEDPHLPPLEPHEPGMEPMQHEIEME